MLWEEGVHIQDPWNHLCCLDTPLKTKNSPVVFTTLEPHPIATYLFTAPNEYNKLGLKDHTSVMYGTTVCHDPLPRM